MRAGAVNQSYKIKKAFLIPLIGVAILLAVLFLMMLFSGEFWEAVAAALMLIVTLLVAIETSGRRFVVAEDGLSIRKFFRTRKLAWPEITHLGVLVISSKAYFLLTTTRGFSILSNLIENHASIIQDLAVKLGKEKVEPEVHAYLERPVERKSLFIMIWVAVAVIIAIIAFKSTTFFNF